MDLDRRDRRKTMPVQIIRCPKCRHEFPQNLPEKGGRVHLQCPKCGFRSSVAAPASEITESDRRKVEKKKVITMRPLVHPVHKKVRRHPVIKRPPERKTKTMVSISTEEERTIHFKAATIGEGLYRFWFEDVSNKTFWTGIQRTLEKVIFSTDKGHEILTLEVLDPHIVVARLYSDNAHLIAYISEKMGEPVRTLIMKSDVMDTVTLRADVTSGPGGYRFSAEVLNSAGKPIGTLHAGAKGFLGEGEFIGKFTDVRAPIAILTTMHFMAIAGVQ